LTPSTGVVSVIKHKEKGKGEHVSKFVSRHVSQVDSHQAVVGRAQQ